MGLVNRRAAIRAENNIYDEGSAQPQIPDWRNVGQERIDILNSQLDVADRTGLELVAMKLIDVQAGAAVQGTAIQVVMPAHGQEFVFRRTLQNDLGGELVLKFSAGHTSAWSKVGRLWPIIPGALVVWVMIGMCLGFKRVRS